MNVELVSYGLIRPSRVVRGPYGQIVHPMLYLCPNAPRCVQSAVGIVKPGVLRLLLKSMAFQADHGSAGAANRFPG